MAQLSSKAFNDLGNDILVESITFEANTPINVDDVLAKLGNYWNVIKPILKIVKIITPPKIDKGVDEFIKIVDRLTGGAEGDEQSELLEKFAIVWGIVRPILVGVQAITGPKIDVIIDEVLKIGDLLAKS